MAQQAGIEIILRPAQTRPYWTTVYDETTDEGKKYVGSCTYESYACLVDPTKLLDVESYAKNELPKKIYEEAAKRNIKILRLSISTSPPFGYRAVLPRAMLPYLAYPAIRVESWHHGSPVAIPFLIEIAMIILGLYFVYLITHEIKEITWKAPEVVSLGLLVLGGLILLALTRRKKE